jgi:hypothetical protein
METLHLPEDILVWEDNMSSQSSPPYNEIFGYDFGLDFGNELTDCKEDFLDDKWVQPLSFQDNFSPDNFYYDNAADYASNSPVSQVQDIANLSPKDSLYNLNSPSGYEKEETEISDISYAIENQVPQYYVNPTPTQCTEDIALEVQKLDELVRLRAQNLPNWAEDDSSLASNSTTASSPRSETSFNSSCSSNAEWPATPTKSKSANDKKLGRNNKYSTEDKKRRKKEQNKNAANRYRLKKKVEMTCVMSVEKGLEQENDKLCMEYTDIKREVKYIKRLLREFYHTKGIPF